MSDFFKILHYKYDCWTGASVYVLELSVWQLPLDLIEIWC